jgi:hypothetical protein
MAQWLHQIVEQPTFRGRFRAMQYQRPLAVLTVVLLLSGVPLLPQEPVVAKSKVAQGFSPEQTQIISELRDRAQRDLFDDHLRYEPPEIAKPLAAPSDFIAIVDVTEVTPPDESSHPYTRVNLRVEQLLRGASQEIMLHAESRWVPPRPQDERSVVHVGGPRWNALDRAEPKVGNRYLIGYSFLYEDGGRAYIPGAIDLNDPDQVRILPEVERFLDIEARATASGFAPFVEALQDEVPWIRDLAAQRLAQSDACNASPLCGDALLTAVRTLLQSKQPGERWEALKWTEPLSQPIGDRKMGPNGLPTISNAAVRELLVSAISDPNVWIGDEAYKQLAMFDFYQSARRGDCIEIVPSVRRFARWTSREAKGVSIGSPLGGCFACIP